jgi:lysophospholipase L1-like esterase
MFQRYVALGDSQTEGLNDGDETRGYRGWADRLAERLAELNPELRYANLAVRGRLTAQVREQQLAPALAMKPDLATLVVGMNDLMRPRFDARSVAADVEAMFAALVAGGACVATATFPDIAKISPAARRLAPRVIELNARVEAAAVSQGVVLFKTFAFPVTTDPRLWSADRIHASPEGHARIARGMAEALCLPGADGTWATPLPAMAHAGFAARASAELRWLRAFALPWMARRVHGRSSGDGCVPKRPTLQRVLLDA